MKHEKYRPSGKYTSNGFTSYPLENDDDEGKSIFPLVVIVIGLIIFGCFLYLHVAESYMAVFIWCVWNNKNRLLAHVVAVTKDEALNTSHEYYGKDIDVTIDGESYRVIREKNMPNLGVALMSLSLD